MNLLAATLILILDAEKIAVARAANSKNQKKAPEESPFQGFEIIVYNSMSYY
jgi:hypothetical protein